MHDGLMPVNSRQIHWTFLSIISMLNAADHHEFKGRQKTREMFKIKSTYRWGIFCVFVCLIVFAGSNDCRAEGITEDKNLTSPEFWISVTGNADKQILDTEQIISFNKDIRGKSHSVVDLTSISDKSDIKDVFKRLSNTNILKKDMYMEGSLFPAEAKNALRNELDLEDFSGKGGIRYGIVVRRANIRSLPMKEGLFDKADDIFFDDLQETSADPSEPVIILHESRSKKFLYVQMYNCSGWVDSSDVAVTDRKTWLEYACPEKFLAVTARSLYLPSGNEKVLYQMGSRILIKQKYPSAFIVRIPCRNADGGMFEKDCIILISDDSVHDGYLSYTRSNIIKQCFKYYGADYGWGGLMDSEDCSGFLNDVYRVFGIYLPRNSGQQADTAGQRTEFGEYCADTRQNIIEEKLSAGDALFMKGHVMIYLGTIGGSPYVIHSLGSHTVHASDGSRNKIRIMKVVVSDLSLRTWAGLKFIDAITNSVSFR